MVLTGALAEDHALRDLIGAATNNPVEEFNPSINQPTDLTLAEYAVNVGLAFKGSAIRAPKKMGNVQALNLEISARSDGPPRQPIKLLVYAVSAALVIALAVPIHQGKLQVDASG